jgi:sugar transferase (PEP-CTERM/EpsH1 system associated)
MNILIVSPNIPSPTWGASTRNYYLLKTLAGTHSVSVLALDERSDKGVTCNSAPLKELTHSVQVIAPPKSSPKRWRQLIDVVRGKSYILKAHSLVEMQDAINAAFARDHYDVVLFESVLVAGYRLPKGVRVIIDQHNIEHELRLRTYEHETAWVRKWYNRLEASLLKPVEIERCRNADAVLVTSERERISLQNMVPGTLVEIVSNGVDIEVFGGHCATQEIPGRVVFTGSMEYYPNVQAVIFFAQRCWPLIRALVPHATWQIVGKNPLPEVQKLSELPGVTVTGTVPDVRPSLSSAEVAVVPLLIGSGTRLKILEALAMRRAVVSTSIGCEGLSVVPGEHLVVADQPEAFAQAVVTLMNEPELRKKFGNAGRELVEAAYSWERCGSQLLNVLQKISRKG